MRKRTLIRNDNWDYRKMNDKVLLSKPNVLSMLVGLPGSGKSTYVDHMIKAYKAFTVEDIPVYVISLDRMIEKTMTPTETYAQAFMRVQHSGELKEMDRQLYADAVKYAVMAGPIVVIWDQTNLTVETRKRKLDIFPSGTWTKFAVPFVPSKEEWRRRLNKRKDETGKSIPEHVLESMSQSYQEPTEAEGFDLILPF
jgi:tRNA uridine 5-carbamoylmethylation protein Kti12